MEEDANDYTEFDPSPPRKHPNTSAFSREEMASPFESQNFPQHIIFDEAAADSQKCRTPNQSNNRRFPTT